VFLLFAGVQGVKGTAMAACGHIPILKAPAPQGSFSGTFTMTVVSCQLSIVYFKFCDLSFLRYQSSVVSCDLSI